HCSSEFFRPYGFYRRLTHASSVRSFLLSLAAGAHHSIRVSFFLEGTRPTGTATAGAGTRPRPSRRPWTRRARGARRAAASDKSAATMARWPCSAGRTAGGKRYLGRLLWQFVQRPNAVPALGQSAAGLSPQ